MSTSSLKIRFDIDYPQWFQYFSLVPQTNLLQSWSYGDAKQKSQGWKVKRGIIYDGEQPIALIQVLYKKILFTKIVRINLGPIWLVHPTLTQIRNVFNIIKKQWNLRTLSAVSIAPNLHNLAEHREILTELGFRQRKGILYESGLVDLTPPVDELRRLLRQKWRNQLNFSEKKALSFQLSQQADDFQWLMARFKELREEKNFFGHPISLLKALYECTFDAHEVWVAIVSHQGERVAASLISFYLSACTPLIIWVSQNGRALNAGNFLLWNSVLYAKERNAKWFDLGGTNNTSKFKTGLPHHPYQMIGEYYFF